MLTIKPVIYACMYEDLRRPRCAIKNDQRRVRRRRERAGRVELVSLDPGSRRLLRSVTLELRPPSSSAPPTTPRIDHPRTSGPTESRRDDPQAGRAPGRVIHGDFERGFIKAETVGYEALVDAGTRKPRRKPASCGARARSTSSRTATSCCSAKRLVVSLVGGSPRLQTPRGNLRGACAAGHQPSWPSCRSRRSVILKALLDDDHAPLLGARPEPPPKVVPEPDSAA